MVTAFGVRGDGEERRGEHGQGDVSVPGVVASNLVVIKTGLVLGELERLFHAPPGSGDADQLGDRHGPAEVADVVGQLAGPGQVAQGHALLAEKAPPVERTLREKPGLVAGIAVALVVLLIAISRKKK